MGTFLTRTKGDIIKVARQAWEGSDNYLLTSAHVGK